MTKRITIYCPWCKQIISRYGPEDGERVDRISQVKCANCKREDPSQ